MAFKPILNNQYLVTLQGLPATYWDTFSGLKDASQTDEYSDGISNRVYKLFGRKELDEMTLGKAFDPIVDVPVIQWYRTWCSGTMIAGTLSVTPIRSCPRPEKIGRTLILYGVEPISLEGFEVDKKATESARLEIQIIATDWSYQ